MAKQESKVSERQIELVLFKEVILLDKSTVKSVSLSLYKGKGLKIVETEKGIDLLLEKETVSIPLSNVSCIVRK